MSIKRISLFVGSVGFLTTLALSFTVTFLERNLALSLHATLLLTRMIEIICPASLGLMATENTGVIGTIIIALIVSFEDFVIYFAAAAFVCILWRKLRKRPLGRGPGDGELRMPVATWKVALLVTLGIVLLGGLSIGLTVYIRSLGWSWYYVPASAGVIAVSVLCFRAAAKGKGMVLGG